MQSHSSSYLVSKYTQMGFSEANISKALQQCQGNESVLLNILCSMSGEGIQSPEIPANSLNTENKEQNQIMKDKTIQPFNPEERLRKNGVAVGLRNVGNTCYVNSLLQTYFMSPKFVSAILAYNPHVHLVEEATQSVLRISQSNLKNRRIEASIELVKSLQKLFTLMIKSHKRFLDPSEVICSVVDEIGKTLVLGEQKDVTEYHLNFISRIEEAFIYQEKYLKANNRFDKPISNPERAKSNSWFNRSALIGSYFSPEKPVSKLPDEFVEGDVESIEWMKRHFYGIMKEYSTITDDKNEVPQQREFIFGPIILNISNTKNLYESLEEYCNITVDDFRDNFGKITQAKQQLWIDEAPEFLVFQLNRVYFDRDTRTSYKTNKEFEFQKEIFLDRHMAKNKNEATKINESIKALKQELKQSEIKEQQITTWLKNTCGATEIMGKTEQLLNSQCSNQEDTSGNCNQNEVETTMKVLKVYRQSLEKQITKIENHISEIKVKINELSESLKQQKYHLASILIHSGEAGRGHYYSFGRNVGNDTWTRFDDSQVTPEIEENVWKEASGGVGTKNAYCLIYLADSIVQEEFNSILMSLAKSTNTQETQVERHHYSDMVPETLLEYVKEDNYAFYQQIEAYRFHKNLDLAIELYKEKYDTVNRAIQRTSMAIPNYLDSFAIFLKSELDDQFLLKWYLLDVSLRETECCPNLRELTSAGSISQIQNKVAILPKPYSLTHIILKPAEKNELDIRLWHYLENYPVITCYKLLLKSFLNEDWKNACYLASRILFMENLKKIKYSKLIKVLAQVICLKIAIRIECDIVKGDVKAVANSIDFLTAIGKGILKQTDIRVLQIKAILSDALDQAQNNLSSSDLDSMKQEVCRFTSGIHQPSELNKPIKDYKPEDLEREIEKASIEELYKWKDLEHEGVSYEVSMLMEGFSQQNQLYVEFQEILMARQKIMSLEERKEKGIFIKYNNT